MLHADRLAHILRTILESPALLSEKDRLLALNALATYDAKEPLEGPPAYTNVEIRFSAETIEFLETVAKGADVTRDQAASVLTVLAMRQYRP